MVEILIYNMKLLCVLFLLLNIGYGQTGPKDRVINEVLSSEEHFDKEEHNPEYDHEAFLGKEGTRTFEELTPEQSKKRLG